MKNKLLNNSPKTNNDLQANFEHLCQTVKQTGWSGIGSEPVSVRDGATVSVFDDNKWDWSHYEKNASSLSKAGVSAGYLNFSNIKNVNVKNEVKLLAYGWMFFVSGRFGKDVNVSYIGFRTSVILSFVSKFLDSQGMGSLSDLSEVNVWGAFGVFVKENDWTYSGCSQIGTTLRAVELLSPHLPFHFATVEKSPTKWARKFARSGTEKNQTLSIPTRLAEVIYGEAVRVVEEAYPHAELIGSTLKKEYQLFCEGKSIVQRMVECGDLKEPVGQRAWTRLAWKHAPIKRQDLVNREMQSTGWVSDNNNSGSWLTTKQRKIQTAAFICVLGFTGMRDGEAFGVKEDCFVHTDIGGLPVDLVQSVHKKLTKGGKVEEWVSCPIVGKAIVVASAITKYMRDQWAEEGVRLALKGDIHESEVAKIASESLWLIQQDKNVLPNYKTSSGVSERLKLFVRECGEEALITGADLDEVRKQNPESTQKIKTTLSVGGHWPLAKHQMRRTFAVFVVKNKLGHPIALKQQFKHIHLKMTEWYANGAMQERVRGIKQDESLNKLIADVLVEETTGIIVDAASGDVSGGFGNAIQGDVTVYGSWDSVYALVKQGRLSLSGTAHGYCKGGYQCDMDGAINPSFCVPCENSLITEAQLSWWRNKRSRLVDYLSSITPSTHELSHFLTQIRAAENVMQSAGDDFQKYSTGIEIKEV